VAAGIDTMAKVFSYDVAGIVSLFQNFLYTPYQLDPLQDLYSNYPQFISAAGQQLDNHSFTDLVKRIEAFPAAECACERLFVTHVI
jgi:hypothetical protein